MAYAGIADNLRSILYRKECQVRMYYISFTLNLGLHSCAVPEQNSLEITCCVGLSERAVNLKSNSLVLLR